MIQNRFEIGSKLANAEARYASEALNGGEKHDHLRRPYLQVHNPSYDYIPPNLISLFLTDHGHGFMPSYVYRQLSEFYHRQDFDLDARL